MPVPAVTVRGVHKRYGRTEALRAVDLDIHEGEVFALLGPNGAGKTTLVEILEGYRDRSEGSVIVLGVDPREASPAWRSRIGIVLQNTTVFDSLSVREIVEHFAGFYPVPLDPVRVIEMVGLSEKIGARCGKLSGGQKRRVDLALGLVGNPDLIFLDEPTTGLDPEGRRQLWDVIRSFTALGKTVLLTTHYLDEAEALAGRVGVIIAGEMVDIAPPAEIGGRSTARAIVRFQAGPELVARLPALPAEAAVRDGFVTILTSTPTAVLRGLAGWAGESGIGELPGLTVTRPSLEDVYLEMVRKGGGGDAAGGVTAMTTVQRPRYNTWIRTRPIVILSVLAAVFLSLSALAFAHWLFLVFLVPAAIFAYILLIVGMSRWRFSAAGGDYQDRVHQLLVSRTSGGRILDIGCGSGHLLAEVAKVRPGAELVGVDYWGGEWEYSREQCIANFRAEGLDGRARFVQASASDLPLELGSFDSVVSCLTFHEVRDTEDKTVPLKQALARLSPGGTFAFVDLFGDPKHYPDPAAIDAAITESNCTVTESADLGRLLHLPFPLQHKRVLGHARLIAGARREASPHGGGDGAGAETPQ